MINVNDFRPGITFISKDNNIYVVIESLHSKSGRGQAHVKAKVKDLRTGTIKTLTLTGGTFVYPALIEKRKCIYLYNDKNHYFFQDSKNYEEIMIDSERLAWEKNFLIEGNTITIKIYNNEILGVELEPTLQLKVIFTEPAVRGNTVGTVMKKAQLETGYEIQVPQFIKIGDVITLNSEDGTYKGRSQGDK